MADPASLDPLRAALADLTAWLRAEGVKGLVIGGVAASILGRPRMTRDVDVVIWLSEDRWEQFLQSSERHGFRPRIADPLGFARSSRVFLLTHQRSGIEADIAIGALRFEEEAIDRGRVHDLGGVAIPLPSPEDLVVMKAVAHRPRDAADIEGLLDANPALDRGHVKGWVKEFADLLESPEILRDLEALFSKVPRG